MVTLAQAVLVKDEDEDEDSAFDTGKTKKRASPCKKRVAELQEENNIEGLLASGKAVLVKDEASDSDWDSPSQWDYDQDSANCAAIWLEIALVGHHD